MYNFKSISLLFYYIRNHLLAFRNYDTLVLSTPFSDFFYKFVYFFKIHYIVSNNNFLIFFLSFFSHLTAIHNFIFIF